MRWSKGEQLARVHWGSRGAASCHALSSAHARNRRRWDSLSECTISYTTTCVTFIDRFTIGKGKCSVLIRLVFTNCSPTAVRLLQQLPSRPGVEQREAFQAGAARTVRSARALLQSAAPHSLRGQRRSSALVFFTHLHPLHLPLRQKGTYKGGSVGSGPATSPPCG